MAQKDYFGSIGLTRNSSEVRYCAAIGGTANLSRDGRGVYEVRALLDELAFALSRVAFRPSGHLALAQTWRAIRPEPGSHRTPARVATSDRSWRTPERPARSKTRRFGTRQPTQLLH